MSTVAGQLARETVKSYKSLLVKQFGGRRNTDSIPFSKEPNNLFFNLRNSYSKHYSGLANKKTVTTQSGGNNLSVVLAPTRTNKQNKPAALLHKSIVTKEFCQMAEAVKNQVIDNHHRPDLKKAALANAIRHKIISGIEIYAQPSIAANNAFGNVRYYNVMVLRSPIMTGSSPATMIESSPVLRKMNYRFYSNDSNNINISYNRPLSPHLPIYKPQLTSMSSIFNRISGAFLSTIVLSFYLLFKMGSICFTYDHVYQFFFFSEKFILIPVGLPASLAVFYHFTASLSALHRG